MVNKVDIHLGTVQETLLIPLWSRAVELQHPDPIVRDKPSADILNAINYDFDKFSAAKATQIGCCLRGLVLDDWVRTYLNRYPQGTVVELGAGLNTRFERVDNGQVRWFDLDLPDAIALRRQFFEETDRRRFIAASALDTTWVEIVKTHASNPVMFLCEGVLMYLAEDQVKQLFANLAHHFPGCWFAFDSIAPLVARRPNAAVKHTSATFDWAIANINEIETWNPTYHVKEICTFRELPKKVPIRHYRRFSWLDRVIFSLPILCNVYRLARVELGSSEPEATYA